MRTSRYSKVQRVYRLMSSYSSYSFTRGEKMPTTMKTLRAKGKEKKRSKQNCVHFSKIRWMKNSQEYKLVKYIFIVLRFPDSFLFFQLNISTSSFFTIKFPRFRWFLIFLFSIFLKTVRIFFHSFYTTTAIYFALGDQLLLGLPFFFPYFDANRWEEH